MKKKHPLAAFKNISKVYSNGHQKIYALQKVNFEIEAGECVAIMGPSGSGKSTLLHLLGCLDQPTEGTYTFNGLETSDLNDDSLSLLRATKIGFVFQSFHLIPQLSVKENIALPLLYQPISLSGEEIDDRTERALKQLKLEDRAAHHPSELSGGESQRTAIARAMIIEPLLLLADEPTGNLDSENAHAILDIFDELNELGTTLTIITHDREVANRCKRTLLLKDGAIRPLA